MSHKFATTYLCDVSEQALQHSASKVAGIAPKTTTDAEQLCASDEVDVIIIANATAFHVPHAILALKYDKYCLLEKPAALNYRDIDSLIQAEASSKGRVLVGYMRRYASAFLEAVQEVGGLSKIQYARVRDIIGPNSDFVSQSGTFPKRFCDMAQADSDQLVRRDEEMAQQALKEEFGVQVTPSSKLMLQLLGG
jgi:predicted dehydrogenase